MKKIAINSHQLTITWALVIAVSFIFWKSEGEVLKAVTNSVPSILIWLVLFYTLSFKICQKIFSLLLLLVFLGAVLLAAYLFFAKDTSKYGEILYGAAYHALAFNETIEVVQTYVGGTDISPEFYMSIKNNSDKAEITCIKAIFSVYDWELDYMKSEMNFVLLDARSDKPAIKPGETKTIKINLSDLRYKKDDIIKYKFIDIKTKKYTNNIKKAE